MDFERFRSTKNTATSLLVDTSSTEGNIKSINDIRFQSSSAEPSKVRVRARLAHGRAPASL